MELTVEVIGMKAFKGSVDGKAIDSGVLYAVVKLDERRNRKDQDGTNWKFGHAIEEWKLPNAEAVMRMSHLQPSMKRPILVKLEIERVSNGSESREIVTDCRPVEVRAQEGEAAATPLRKAA